MIAEMATLIAGSIFSQGASPVALEVDRESGEVRRHLNRSLSFGLGRTGIFEELWAVSEQCGSAGWDGASAVPVSSNTYLNAFRFLESLPLGIVAPIVGAEPDGHITFEWYVHPRRTLSVSVSPEGELHYAALLGASKAFGSEPFFGEPPKAIIDLIQRVGRS
jgi:hypothetical protein